MVSTLWITDLAFCGKWLGKSASWYIRIISYQKNVRHDARNNISVKCTSFVICERFNFQMSKDSVILSIESFLKMSFHEGCTEMCGWLLSHVEVFLAMGQMIALEG